MQCPGSVFRSALAALSLLACHGSLALSTPARESWPSEALSSLEAGWAEAVLANSDAEGFVNHSIERQSGYLNTWLPSPPKVVGMPGEINLSIVIDDMKPPREGYLLDAAGHYALVVLPLPERSAIDDPWRLSEPATVRISDIRMRQFVELPVPVTKCVYVDDGLFVVHFEAVHADADLDRVPEITPSTRRGYRGAKIIPFGTHQSGSIDEVTAFVVLPYHRGDRAPRLLDLIANWSDLGYTIDTPPNRSGIAVLRNGTSVALGSIAAEAEDPVSLPAGWSVEHSPASRYCLVTDDDHRTAAILEAIPNPDSGHWQVASEDASLLAGQPPAIIDREAESSYIWDEATGKWATIPLEVLDPPAGGHFFARPFGASLAELEDQLLRLGPGGGVEAVAQDIAAIVSTEHFAVYVDPVSAFVTSYAYASQAISQHQESEMFAPVQSLKVGKRLWHWPDLEHPRRIDLSLAARQGKQSWRGQLVCLDIFGVREFVLFWDGERVGMHARFE